MKDDLGLLVYGHVNVMNAPLKSPYFQPNCPV